jgi:ATP-dependent DNA helicase RecG
MIESWGRGIYKILNECAKANVPAPTYEFYWGGIEVHFKSVKILALMRETPEITIPALAKETGITIRSVERAIEKLKKENKIERIGADKGGYWKVIGNSK